MSSFVFVLYFQHKGLKGIAKIAYCVLPKHNNMIKVSFKVNVSLVELIKLLLSVFF